VSEPFDFLRNQREVEKQLKEPSLRKALKKSIRKSLHHTVRGAAPQG